MAEGLEDYDMTDLDTKYPEYDDMDYNQLEKEYDDLGSIEEAAIEDPSKANIFYLTGQQETSFNDNDDGKTITINKNNREVSASRDEFVKEHVPNAYDMPDGWVAITFDPVTRLNFDLALLGKGDEFEGRFEKLSESNKKQVQRVQRINEKIQERYTTKLGDDKVSREIVDRTQVNSKGYILFKYTKQDGELGRPLTILVTLGSRYINCWSFDYHYCWRTKAYNLGRSSSV